MRQARTLCAICVACIIIIIIIFFIFGDGYCVDNCQNEADSSFFSTSNELNAQRPTIRLCSREYATEPPLESHPLPHGKWQDIPNDYIRPCRMLLPRRLLITKLVPAEKATVSCVSALRIPKDVKRVVLDRTLRLHYMDGKQEQTIEIIADTSACNVAPSARREAVQYAVAAELMVCGYDVAVVAHAQTLSSSSVAELVGDSDIEFIYDRVTEAPETSQGISNFERFYGVLAPAVTNSGTPHVPNSIDVAKNAVYLYGEVQVPVATIIDQVGMVWPPFPAGLTGQPLVSDKAIFFTAKMHTAVAVFEVADMLARDAQLMYCRRPMR